MAYIADLVVKISASTKSFEPAIVKTGQFLQQTTSAATNTVAAISRLNGLTISNAPAQLALVSTEMHAVERSTLSAVTIIDSMRASLTRIASATGLATLALNVITGAQSRFTIAGQILTRRLDQLYMKLGALRATMGPVASVLGTIARGAMIVSWPLRMILSIVVSLSKPFLSVAMSVMAFHMSLKTLGIQMSWIKKLLAFLPMKVKVLMLGLFAAGAAATAFGMAGRLAAKAVSLLMIPLVAIKSPMTALKMAAMQAGQGLLFMHSAARKTIGAVTGLAGAIVGGLWKGLTAVPRMLGRTGTAVAALGSMSAGAAVLGVLKLAQNAETLAMQFRVLTGSAETAARIIGQLDAFAAETPFQKMEIGEAARMLISFGSSADTVFNELRMLGDIAAATGTPLGELAEIYGKNRVQGRLFAMDVNQLAGRGIPIYAGLAKVMGTTESQIRGMVESGKVGFVEMQKAMAAMVSDGGAYGGMMQQLSTTTAGKWSTFVDNVKLMATTFGNALLPHANALMDWASGFLPQLQAIGDGFGAAVTAGVQFGLKTFQAIYDVGTVIGVVAGNMDNVWAALWQEVPKYASAAFDWITQNAALMLTNIGILVQNLYAQINSVGLQLGEEIAFQLGLSDEVLNIAEATQRPLNQLSEFKAPEAAQVTKDLMKDIDRALEANAAARLQNKIADEVKKQEGLGDLGTAKNSTAGGDKTAGRQQELSGALQKGSAEAYSAIFSAMNRGGDEQTKATNNVANVLKREVAKPLQKIAMNTSGSSVVESFA